jgi:hypothetical protein
VLIAVVLLQLFEQTFHNNGNYLQKFRDHFFSKNINFFSKKKQKKQRNLKHKSGALLSMRDTWQFGTN